MTSPGSCLSPKPIKLSSPAAQPVLNLSDFTKGESAIFSCL